MARKNDTATLNRKCDHCLRSSVRVHCVSARPEEKRHLLAVGGIIYFNLSIISKHMREL